MRQVLAFFKFSDKVLPHIPVLPTKIILQKKIIVEGYRAEGSLNDSFQSLNFFVVVFVLY